MSVKIFNYSDIFFSAVHEGDTICTNRAFAHVMIYVHSGEMFINEQDEEIHVGAGECVFIRRDHKVNFTKKPTSDEKFMGITLLFNRGFLQEYYQRLDHKHIPRSAAPLKKSVMKLPDNPEIKSIYVSMMPYFDTDKKPAQEILDMKMQEGVLSLLKVDERFYPTLFDFTDPWKIDILEFLNKNYMYDLSMEEIASYTGRSLSTFKRDFKKISDLPPQKWLMQRRLEAAYEMVREGKRKVTDICYDVGFKNRSHFTIAFKKHFGFSPSTAS